MRRRGGGEWRGGGEGGCGGNRDVGGTLENFRQYLINKFSMLCSVVTGHISIYTPYFIDFIRQKK